MIASGRFIAMRSSRYGRGRHYIFLGLGLLIVTTLSFVGVRIWLAMNNQNHGTIITDQNQGFASASPQSTTTLDAPAFQLDYPMSFERSTQENTAQADFTATLIETEKRATSQARQVGITYRKLTTGFISDDVSYRLYEARSDAYSIQPTADNGSVEVTRKQADTLERIIFIPHDGEVLIIDVSGGQSVQAIDDLFGQLLRGLRWR